MFELANLVPVMEVEVRRQRRHADISRDEVVGCWSNQDEVVEVVIVDHRLLLGV